MSTFNTSSASEAAFLPSANSAGTGTASQAAWNAPLGLPPAPTSPLSLPDSPAHPLTNDSVAPSPLPKNTASANHAAEQTAKSEQKRNRFVRGETTDVWGLPLDRVRMSDAIAAIDNMIADREPRYVITANLNYAMLVDGDTELKKITNEASMVLADGQPLVWRSRLRAEERLPERVAGSELIYRLAEIAALRGWRIYFLGAEPGVAKKCADTLASLYPGLQIAGVQSPPYRKLTEAEEQKQHQAIIDSRPDILFVAFGQPKGERWIYENYKQLGVPVSIQIGASFDFVAGTAKRAPKRWQMLGMEWAYRMFSDPGRLMPRYAANAWFLFIALLRDWCGFVNAKFGQASSQPEVTQST
jgi:N-acetylglucosaminyldiphosphoundecaprenol N-acetyl-beta-D-mannosaminyltransferase